MGLERTLVGGGIISVEDHLARLGCHREGLECGATHQAERQPPRQVRAQCPREVRSRHEREVRSRLLGHVRGLDAALHDADLVCTGPWPAYSFVEGSGDE